MPFMPPNKPNPLFQTKGFTEAGQDMLMWMLGLPRRKRNEFPAPQYLLPGSGALGPDDGAALQGLNPGASLPPAAPAPGYPAPSGLFRGPMYEPRVGKGLLDIDPSDPQLRSLPGNTFAPPARSAWDAAPALGTAGASVAPHSQC